MSMQRLDEAVIAFQRVNAIDRRFAPAYRMCASVLHQLGRIDEMINVCRAGHAANPERFEIESFELLGLNFVDGLSCEALFARHRSFGERLEMAIPRRFSAFRNGRDPERRLKIGFISGDFSYHPVALFLIPFIERLDKARLEIAGYHVATTTDAITSVLRSRMDRWRDASAMPEEALANAVHSDGIDILVDLSGHTGVARLGVFAQQPAPVQATWLGYTNTTGLTRMQYRISDAVCAPPGIAEQWHTEKVMRLPHAYFCYRPFFSVAASPQPPLEKNGFVTFGVFTQIAKLNSRMRTLWAQILRQVPDSRLVIAGVTSPRTQAALIEALHRDGIDPARVRLLPFMPVQEYLRAFDSVDFVLDTSPYSGGTTTCDALWMGVPVLTLPAERPASRTAASVLTTVGLTGWIASSANDYLDRAVRFAADRQTIADLRGSLRGQMAASPLMQEAEFASDLEKAFRAMWRTWCADAAS
jgi:protein O-GlcNAc transferase